MDTVYNGGRFIKVMSNTMRKLARLAQITDIQPIPGADAIEVATVDGGWKVVVKKDEYKVNEVAIYCEVDSWIPHSIAPFLSKGKEPRVYEGVEGERLRTVKLRGQISQGLLLKLREVPLSEQTPVFARPHPVYSFTSDDGADIFTFCVPLGEDLSDILEIQKWEAPVPAQLAGNVEGAFPSYIRKTDQERCQNLPTEIFTDHVNDTYEVTEKLEGSSMTVFRKDGHVGVCSRNLELKDEGDNTFWKVAKECGLIRFLTEEYHRNIAIQGELIGEGVQKNYYGIKGHRFYVYDIYDIDEGKYWGATMRGAFINSSELGLLHVPVTYLGFLSELNITDLDKLINFADGHSIINESKAREGLVFKSITDPQFSFKAISNKYLLKNQ